MNKFTEGVSNGRIFFIGHRGAHGECPENAISGFKRALELGLDGLETDLHGTTDGRIVLMHDDNVFSTSLSTGKLTEMTFEQTRAINVAGKFRPDWGFESVPTLEELFELVKDSPEFLLNLELKDYPEVIGDRAYATCDEIVRLVEEYGMGDRIILNTFSCALVRYIYTKYGDKYPIHTFFPEYLMVGKFDYDIYAHSLYVCQINVKKRPDGSRDWGNAQLEPIIPHAELERLKQFGVATCICMSPWDTEENMRRCLEEGMTMFTCNYPSHSKQILEKLGVR